MQQIEQKILKIVETFGMKAPVVAKAMNISVQTFYSKKHPGNTWHYFTQKNLDDLLHYLKTELQKFESNHQEATHPQNDIQAE